MPRSPLAPAAFPALPPVAGVRLSVARAGYKAWDRTDLLLAQFVPGTTVAGVLTRSKCPSPEVDWCAAQLPRGIARALVVNAGNANAFTGARGAAAVAGIVAAVSDHIGCIATEVFVASTGVIGVPLPLDKATAGLKQVFTATACSWQDATESIGTTDTFPKAATQTAIVDGVQVSLVGIVKGSGMIAPDLATLLGFVFTDAAIAAPLLQAMLRRAAATSFNCITVDSDTSTSDTVLAFATGTAANPRLDTEIDPGADAFAAALTALCRDLAQLVVRDGEGASKIITVDVSGAESDAAARRIAFSIANSPLVKTAIGGGDANWGRIVMAVGKAGEAADRDRLSIRFGTTLVAAHGAVVDDYDEAPVARHLAGSEIDIAVEIGLGDGRARVWTCDLTHGYVSINGDYRS